LKGIVARQAAFLGECASTVSELKAICPRNSTPVKSVGSVPMIEVEIFFGTTCYQPGGIGAGIEITGRSQG
jgi:hypothetical protein